MEGIDVLQLEARHLKDQDIGLLDACYVVAQRSAEVSAGEGPLARVVQDVRYERCRRALAVGSGNGDDRLADEPGAQLDLRDHLDTSARQERFDRPAGHSRAQDDQVGSLEIR
jgi:hypothetical protein